MVFICKLKLLILENGNPIVTLGIDLLMPVCLFYTVAPDCMNCTGGVPPYAIDMESNTIATRQWNSYGRFWSGVTYAGLSILNGRTGLILHRWDIAARDAIYINSETIGIRALLVYGYIWVLYTAGIFSISSTHSIVTEQWTTATLCYLSV